MKRMGPVGGRRRTSAEVIQQMETLEERISAGTEDKSSVDDRKMKKVELAVSALQLSHTGQEFYHL